MEVIDSNVYEYDVSTAYDISTSSYNGNSYTLTNGSSSLTQPKSVAFNSDGTKMFMVESSQRRVYEYSLSTAFDITSASYSNNNLSISSQESSPSSITFNNDGTKIFLVGTNGQDVNEYTLSTGFDLSSTVNFIGSFDVSSQEIYPSSITFNNDGTKMFVSGHSGDDVNEYSLTTPFSLVNVSGEHSGDVINTSSTDNYDTDPDSDTLTVTAIRVGSSEGSGTAGSVGSALTGTYGQLTIAANGSYTYVANQDAADALDAGDVVTDTFNYTVSDGQGETDIAVLTITVNGINDAPVAQNDVGVIVEDGTLTVANSANANLSGSYDATGEHSGDVIDTSSSHHIQIVMQMLVHL